MSRTLRTRAGAAALVTWTVVMLLLAVGLVLLALNWSTRVPEGPAISYRAPNVFGVALTVYAIAFTSVGALIASRHSRNPIGWIFCGVGLLGAAELVGSQYATYGLLTAPGSLPRAELAAWVYEWSAIVAGSVLTTFVLLLFPNGRLPSRAWRPVFGLAGVAWVLFGAGVAFIPGPLPVAVYVRNPLGVSALAETLLSLILLGGGLALSAIALSIASLVARYRDAHRDERQQIKWIAYAAGLNAVAVPAYSLSFAESAAGPAVVALIAATIPVATGVAILRYRLYEIDLLINRTVLYFSVTAILAALFAILSTVSQRAAEALTGQRSDLVTIALALVLALGFTPLRRRIQPLVDRVLPGRGLLTLLFTDIVGSTERIVALGDERWRAVLESYRAAVRRELARFGGREVDTAGDGFFATFERPTQAVRCAVALRDSLRDLGLGSRVGLHSGECELRGERVSGLNVVVAARIMASANANEIIASSALRDLLDDTGFRFRDRGTESLKGVPGEWRLSFVDEGLGPG